MWVLHLCVSPHFLESVFITFRQPVVQTLLVEKACLPLGTFLQTSVDRLYVIYFWTPS